MLPRAPPWLLARAWAYSGTTGPSLVAGTDFDFCRAVTGGRVELHQFVFRLSVLQVAFLSLIRLLQKHLCKRVAFDGFMLNLMCCATDSSSAFFCVSRHYVTKPSSSGFGHCVSLISPWLAVRVDFIVIGVLENGVGYCGLPVYRVLYHDRFICRKLRKFFFFGHPVTPTPQFSVWLQFWHLNRQSWSLFPYCETLN
jgi:hypothetical protein